MNTQKPLLTYYGFIFIKKVSGDICGRFPVTKKECIIGRDKSCDIKIFLENVSAQHCVIIYANDKAYIRDTSVAGSTLVNDKKIGRKSFILNHSDEINICGRKFIWEYAKSYININKSPDIKNSIKNNKTLQNVLEHTPKQINTPLVPKDINKTLNSPRAVLKKPITFNRTPIVVPTTNMSASSFDELKNSLQEQNSTSIPPSKERRIMKSLSMIPGRNIPLIGDPKSTPRKSWAITPDHSSSSGVHILNRLSVERVKRDSTPEYKDNTSYHYADENIEFDSPEPPSTMLNDEYYSEPDVDCSVTDNNQNDDNIDNPLQFTDHVDNILPICEPSTSRRDTYSIDTDEPIAVEQNTPPRRSILKSSKSTKPNKSKSSCRMVQFARLPKTDIKSKPSINVFSKTSNFIVTNDEPDESNHFKNTMDFYVEDDDLDGVQPLDSSVSSLINSPILDSSTIKSSKRGSRGNKVMSLISSLENRSNVTPKNSLRASDLLSTGGSNFSNASSQKDKNVSRDSISSIRRVNLEDVFLAEDSCNINSEETMVQEVDRNPMHSSKVNLLHDTDAQQLSNNITSTEEEEDLNFTLPPNLFELSSINLPATDSNNKTFIDTEESNDVTKITTNSCETSTDKSLVISNKFDGRDLDLSSVNGDENIDNSQRECSKDVEQTMDAQVSTIDSRMPTNVSENSNESIDTEKDNSREQNNSVLPKKSTDIKRKHLDVQNVEELVKKSIGVKKSNLNVQNSVTELSVKKSVTKEKDDIDAQNNSSIVEKSSSVKKNLMDIQNASELVESPTQNEKSSIGESPSMIVQGMSEPFNTTEDEIETTLSIESFVMVEKDDISNSLDINEVGELSYQKSVATTININSNESMMNATEVQSNKILSNNNKKSDCNKEKTICSDSKLSRLNNKETPSSSLVLEIEVAENSTNKLDDNDNSLEENNTGSASNSAENISSTVISSNVSELSTRVLENEDSAVKSNSTNNSNSKLIGHSKTMDFIDLYYNKNENSSPRLTRKKISNLDRSIPNPISAKDFKMLNKSTKTSEDATIEHQNTKTRSLKKVVKVVSLSSDSDETLKDPELNKSNVSFGKPKFESTPWNGSKSSKSIQPNEETKNNMDATDMNTTKHNWSQMMNDLNASVKKAFFTKNTENNLSSNHTANKRKSEVLCSPNVTEVTKNSKNRNPSKVAETTTDKINSNNTKKSTRSKLLKDPQAKKKITNKKSIVESSESENDGNDKMKLSSVSSTSVSSTRKKIKISPASPSDAVNINCDSSDSSDSSFKSSSVSSDDKNIKIIKKKKSITALPPTKINLRARTRKNESNKAIEKRVKVNAIDKQEKVHRSASETTSTDTDGKICSLEIANILPTSRRKEQNISNKKIKLASKGTNSTKPKKNISNIETNADKIKETKKTEIINSPVKTRLTRSHTTVTDSRQTMLNKNNKTSSPVESKSSKVVKTTGKKSSKSTKRSQSKRVLPSQPVSKYTSDSSECSTNVSDEEMEVEPDLPKTNKEKPNKRVVRSSTKCNLRENNRDTSNVSIQVSTRSRKRTATDSSPFTQPNAKSTKNDISSKVASTTLSGGSNSNTRCTRMVSKLPIIQDSDGSTSENSVDNKTEKLSMSSEKTQAKKRALITENESSNSSGPSTRKMTRKVTTKDKKTEIKKSTRATSKNQVQNTDTNKHNSKVRFDKKVEKSVSSEPIKTKSSTQAASRMKTSNISPRVLRTRK